MKNSLKLLIVSWLFHVATNNLAWAQVPTEDGDSEIEEAKDGAVADLAGRAIDLQSPLWSLVFSARSIREKYNELDDDKTLFVKASDESNHRAAWYIDDEIEPHLTKAAMAVQEFSSFTWTNSDLDPEKENLLVSGLTKAYEESKLALRKLLELRRGLNLAEPHDQEAQEAKKLLMKWIVKDMLDDLTQTVKILKGAKEEGQSIFPDRDFE